MIAATTTATHGRARASRGARCRESTVSSTVSLSRASGTVGLWLQRRNDFGDLAPCD